MESGQPGGNSSRMQMTKAVLFASCFWMLFVFGSCTGQQAPQAPVADARVTELQNKVDALEKKVEDLQLKGQIVSSILFKLSEQRFLHSTRFWTEVYDSAHANCAREETRRHGDTETCSTPSRAWLLTVSPSGLLCSFKLNSRNSINAATVTNRPLQRS